MVHIDRHLRGGGQNKDMGIHVGNTHVCVRQTEVNLCACMHLPSEIPRDWFIINYSFRQNGFVFLLCASGECIKRRTCYSCGQACKSRLCYRVCACQCEACICDCIHSIWLDVFHFSFIPFLPEATEWFCSLEARGGRDTSDFLLK